MLVLQVLLVLPEQQVLPVCPLGMKVMSLLVVLVVLVQVVMMVVQVVQEQDIVQMVQKQGRMDSLPVVVLEARVVMDRPVDVDCLEQVQTAAVLEVHRLQVLPALTVLLVQPEIRGLREVL